MKAKEMASRYQADPTLYTLKSILLDMLNETAKIAKDRKCAKGPSLVAVMRQQDDKWQAFARLCPGVEPTSYKRALLMADEDVKKLWPEGFANPEEARSVSHNRLNHGTLLERNGLEQGNRGARSVSQPSIEDAREASERAARCVHRWRATGSCEATGTCEQLRR